MRDRRKRILSYYMLGYSPTLIVRLVSDEFGVSERTVWRDWSSRKEWMSSVAGLDDSGVEAYLRFSFNLFVVRESLWMMIEDTSNVYGKVKACREIVDALFREFEFACDLGYYEQYNKAQTMWRLLRESAGGDMKLVIDGFMGDHDEC